MLVGRTSKGSPTCDPFDRNYDYKEFETLADLLKYCDRLEPHQVRQADYFQMAPITKLVLEEFEYQRYKEEEVKRLKELKDDEAELERLAQKLGKK